MSLCWCVHVQIWESTFVSVHIFEFGGGKEGEKVVVCVCVCVFLMFKSLYKKIHISI